MRKPRRAATALSSGSAMARLARRRTALPRRVARRARSTNLRTWRSGIAPDLGDVLAAELHRERLGPQALALAGVAGARHEEAPELVVGDAALARVGVLVVRVLGARVGQRGEALLEPRDDPLVALLLRAPLRPRHRRSPKRMALRCSSGSFAHGDVGAHAERLDRARQLGRERHAAAPAPREDDALAQRVARVADAALGVDDVARAEAVARGARAVRAVEREHARLDGRQRDAAVDAREALAHPERLVVARPARAGAPRRA